MGRFDCRRKGFTITEFIAVMVIMGLVIGGAIAIYIRSTTTWKEGGVQIILQREASIAMEKMVRGVYGINGVREASSISLPLPNGSGSTIKYTSGIDNQERSFYLSSSEIIYDPDTSTSSDEFSIAENVSGLTFSLSADSKLVTINLDMEGQVIDRPIKVNLSTKVKLRN